MVTLLNEVWYIKTHKQVILNKGPVKICECWTVVDMQHFALFGRDQNHLTANATT